ncbi:polysaccharide deacetylase family protein [Marinobacter changyiensis]|uniref:polysaccharide deacetylase family protein n=1 Tax=Marinobacter changyiensis TaxID=2604091 RepID=UPI0012642A03|nr:polysaccharide deacetylase family protein [Marinobacter changyiensis]
MKATLFVLGQIAERFPELIKKLSDHGNEIASHGYCYQISYYQSREVFRDGQREL